MIALQRSGPDLGNGLSDESDLPAFLDISITSYHRSSFLCVLSVNPGPLLIFLYQKYLLPCLLCTWFCTRQRDGLFSWSFSSGGAGNPDTNFSLCCCFFSYHVLSYLSSVRPHLTPLYLSFYPGPLLA